MDEEPGAQGDLVGVAALGRAGGSRSAAIRCSSSAASSRRPYQAAFQASAWRATSPSMRGRLPAIRIGGPFGRGPRGSSSASARCQRPSNVTPPVRRRGRTTTAPPRSGRPDGRTGSRRRRTPARASRSRAPRISRPPETSSRAAAILASSGGIAERERQHHRADLDSLRDGGDRGQDRPALVDAARRRRRRER